VKTVMTTGISKWNDELKVKESQYGF
jgi:hypothetical protein